MRKHVLGRTERDTEHELTNLRIANRKHHFRTDELSAVVAPGDTTRGACCWTPDAALAERARLRDIRWPEYLAMEALQYSAMRIFAPASQSLIISNKERLRKQNCKKLLGVADTATSCSPARKGTVCQQGILSNQLL
jgi:hypothetical protein